MHQRHPSPFESQKSSNHARSRNVSGAAGASFVVCFFVCIAFWALGTGYSPTSLYQQQLQQSTTTAPLQTTATQEPEPIRTNPSQVFASLHAGTMNAFPNDAILPHLMWIPLANINANSSSSCYPLLVYLHGAGEIGNDLSLLYTLSGARGSIPYLLHKKAEHEHTQQPSVSKIKSGFDPASALFERYVIVMPQTTNGWQDDSQAELLNKLIERITTTAVITTAISSTSPSESGDNKRNKKGEKRVFLNIDANRVFITGVSNGGHGALRAAQLKPSLYAAAILVCGFGDATEMCASFANRLLPLFIVHGANDGIVPVTHSEELFERCAERYYGSTSSSSLPSPDSKVENGSEAALAVSRVSSSCTSAIHSLKAAADTSVKPSQQILMKGKIVFLRPKRTPDPDDEPGHGTGHAAWKPAYQAHSPLWLWLEGVTRR